MRVRATAAVSEVTLRRLEDLPGLGLNFDPDTVNRKLVEEGWRLDELSRPLLSEDPGPPEPEGPFTAACRLVERYAFADPAIVRAAYDADAPLLGRNMVLEGRFYGLRFRLGVRVEEVIDRTDRLGGRDVVRWGWTYRTLEGHLERGQMSFEVWKWCDTGEVEFHINAISHRAPIPNPIVRLGFRAFGRWMQLRWLDRSLDRMEALVRETCTSDRDRARS